MLSFGVVWCRLASLDYNQRPAALTVSKRRGTSITRVEEKPCPHPAVGVVNQERIVRYEKGYVSVFSDEGHGRNLGTVFLAHTRTRRERNRNFVNRRQCL